MKELVDRLDLNLLRTLHVLLEEENVTRAAARLSITQSAVSHALAKLREHFDDPLLVRASGGMVCTPTAVALRAPLAKLMSEINALATRGRAFDPALEERRFAIEAADREQLVLLPSVMAAIAREAPRVDLHVSAPGGPPLQALENGALDLAIGIYDEAPASFASEKLYDIQLSVVARGDHARARSGLGPEEYAALPHLLVAPRRGTTGIVDEALSRAGLSRRVALTVPSFLVAPWIVASTDLVLTIDDRVARTFDAKLGLTILAPPIELEGYAVSMLWHTSRDADEGHRWLRRTIAAAALGI